jgi:hypothetical protein
MNISDQVATRNVNLAVIQFWPGTGPELTDQNHHLQ